jgi:hypothetical protein
MLISLVLQNQHTAAGKSQTPALLEAQTPAFMKIPNTGRMTINGKLTKSFNKHIEYFKPPHPHRHNQVIPQTIHYSHTTHKARLSIPSILKVKFID